LTNYRVELDKKTRQELLAYFEALSDTELRKVIIREGAHKMYMKHQLELINEKYPLKI